jgi:hypothetical protein
MSTAIESGTDILLRAIRTSEADLPPEASRWLLRVQLSPEDCEKVNQLAAKARAGTLTSEERSELDELERVTSFLELMQSKARLSLKNSGLFP